MTRAVWKYTLGYGLNNLAMPAGARVVHVGDQHGLVTLWAEVDPAADREQRLFVFVGTGHDADGGEYVGSAIVGGGALVWHVYEVTA